MADALSLLRQYNIQKKPITDSDGHIIFDQFTFPKGVKTNYLIYKTGKDGVPKDYYTVESLLFLLRNVTLSYPLYVQKAVAQKIPVVRLPDRRGVLSYLNGEVDTSASVDKSAPLELGVQRTATPSTAAKRPAQSEAEISAKKQKLEEQEERMRQDKERIAAKLDAPEQTEVITDKIRSLSDTLSAEKIAAIKAMRLAKKRATIKSADDELDRPAPPQQDDRLFLAADVDVTRDIVTRERIHRTRSTVLHSSGKAFGNVLSILSSVKAREEGGKRPVIVQSENDAGKEKRNAAPASYSRYDQERFRTSQDTEGFSIDTMGTYHGLSLQTVTEKAEKVQQKTTAQLGAMSPNSRPSRPNTGGTSTARSNFPQKKGKDSRTPIIVIPAAPTSLLNMLNVKDFLQEYKFLSSDKKKSSGAKREAEVLVQRKKDSGSVLYRVLDNPTKLSQPEWDRVVAVFVQGPAWQFKGWPWLTTDGSPVDIFARVKAFHLKYEGNKTELNVQKWNVQVLEVSQTKRHLDRASILKFWEMMDKFISKNFPQLRY
ncbi:parafibromin-like [Corticium candelabrum]|uniref:parafibromin-like n=1 Tax=Corticium candelabrum TaxID=121492 RepID=UPI002E256D6E|nr:parafibromin-like [Corticium candelabrum]